MWFAKTLSYPFEKWVLLLKEANYTWESKYDLNKCKKGKLIKLKGCSSLIMSSYPRTRGQLVHMAVLVLQRKKLSQKN
ncbi:hypothetical protein CEXT_194111 [Caerostris extrusa]|uniref:Uncharacterized protein n=1 Tax=Caerostris extrusa TaxID=172846 RepID=A0AAV4N3K5_CAEEX|nr:hypothetical protein CEXT_194111 [Caerostris extrusa]